LTDGPGQPEVKSVPKHKKNPDLGMKETVYTKQVYLDADDAVGLVDGEEVHSHFDCSNDLICLSVRSL
jgi:glutamyl-tRNA synthetase